MTVALLLCTVYSVSPFKPLTLFACMETLGLHHNGEKKLKTTQISFTKLQRIVSNISFFQPSPILGFISNLILTSSQITLLPSLYHNQHFSCAYTFPHLPSTHHCFPCRRLLLPCKGSLLFGSAHIFGKLKSLWTCQIRTTLLRKLKTVSWGWWMSSKVGGWYSRNLNCYVFIYQMSPPTTGLTKLRDDHHLPSFFFPFPNILNFLISPACGIRIAFEIANISIG